jgi:hypothetical protein
VFAKQLTVFIENRTGRLCDVLDVLKNNQVSILSMSLADTTEFGLLRLIVNEPALGRQKLTENGFSSLVSEVSIIKIPHTVGALQEVLKQIDQGGVSIEYMYGLSLEGDSAYVVLKSSDGEKLEEILNTCGVETISAEHLVKP